jgi:hypothetical protein
LVHQPGDEVHVARDSIEPGDDHWTTAPSSRIHGCGKLGTTLEGIATRTTLGLLKPVIDYEALSGREVADRLALGLKAKPRALLALRADPNIANRILELLG